MLTRTTTALLEGLLDPADQETWRAFDARLRPILIAFARRLGLGPEDAADAAQEALARFVKSYRAGRYDRDRGRLRSWLIGIAKNAVAEIKQRKAAYRRERGLSAIDDMPDEAQLTRAWDVEFEQEILRQGVTELRRRTRTEPRTIQAFEMLVLEGLRPAEVAGRLDMTANDVYLAKHRCLKRLRAILEEVRQLYEVG